MFPHAISRKCLQKPRMQLCRGTGCIKAIKPQALLHSFHIGGCCGSNLHGFEVLNQLVIQGQTGMDLGA